MTKTLILASKSPYRQALLKSTGLTFKADVAPIDEHTIKSSDPFELAKLRAEAKALAALALYPKGLVIGCDQVAALGNSPFDKAKTLGEAKHRLKELSGKTHHLYSAWSLAELVNGHPKITHSEVEVIPMPMRSLTEGEIDKYLELGEWQGCVGCYQFENAGINLFDGVKSDSSAIMGLPLQPLLKALRQLNINPLNQG